jgi:hypothetical protein
MNHYCRLTCIIAALACAASFAAEPTAPAPATQPLTDAQIRQRLAVNLKDSGAYLQPLEKILAFLSDMCGVPIQADWPALQKAGVSKNTIIDLFVRERPFQRALLEALDQAAPDQLTYVLDRGTLKIRPRDDSRESRRQNAATLVTESQTAFAGGDAEAAIALLAQAHIIDPSANPQMLPKVLASLKPGREPMAFTADGRIQWVEKQADWLKAHAALRGRLDDNLKEITFSFQGLENVLNSLYDNMAFDSHSENWPKLNAVEVDRKTPIDLSLKNQSLERVLTAVLVAAGKDKIGFINNDGILTISTLDDLQTSPRYQSIRVCDVRPLLDAPAGANDPDAALARQARSDKLLAQVKAAADEKSWTRGGCYVEEFAGLLFVRQDDPNQVQIAKLLALLRSPQP